MSDEHTRDITGCYRDPIVKTPNIDALAASGTKFVNAYTNSPICVPTRASFATGRYVHQIGCWDSAQPYHGQFPSWGHRLMSAGHGVVSIGKLHYRNSNDSNGFDEEILPVHIHKGIGWTKALLRKELRNYPEAQEYANDIGPGESSYTRFDRRVRDAACDWLQKDATALNDKPWVLFVGFFAPHFPLIAPQRFYELYSPEQIPPPRNYRSSKKNLHPAVAAIDNYFNYDKYFDEDRVKIARTAYYGLCSFVDECIGKIIGTLKKTGQINNTRIIYTSDHGDLLGNHGFWAKSLMYEESVAIPMILAGEGVPKNKTVSTPVSLVDCYQTILESAGLELPKADRALPGYSLTRIANGELSDDRVVFSEYHDGGSITGTYMIRTGRWKYIYHVGYRPQLFNLETDPDEMNDLGAHPTYTAIFKSCEAKLRDIVDPELANESAFGDQRKKIDELGGVDAIKKEALWGFTPPPD